MLQFSRFLSAFLALVLFFVGLPALALDSLTRVKLFTSLPVLEQACFEGRCRLEPLGIAVPLLRLRAQGNSVLVSFGPASRLNGSGPGSGPGSSSGSDSDIILRGKEKRLARLTVRTLGAPLLISARGGAAQDRHAHAHAHHYRGIFRVTASGGRLIIVDEVDTRSYITSVVGSESLADFPLEALKAQTVLASTVLAAAARNNIIGDSTELQAYLGSDYERPRVKKAVAAVYGETLSFGRAVKSVYYHSTCAGGTSASAVFNGEASEGKDTVKCSNCAGSPFFKEHRVTVPLTRLRQKLGFLPEQILTRDAQGRPLKVLILRSGRQDTISGYDLWLKLGAALGWGDVPGLRYRFEKTPGYLVFISSGAGHGVGMCQWGATGMARAGKKYKAILNYYFPGSLISGMKP